MSITRRHLLQYAGAGIVGGATLGIPLNTLQAKSASRLAPANMPKANIDKLSAALISIIRSPEVRARLAAQGAEVSTMNPAEMDTFFNAERKKWAGVVAKSGLKLD